MRLESNDCTFSQITKALESLKTFAYENQKQLLQSGNSVLDTTYTLKSLTKSNYSSIDKDLSLQYAKGGGVYGLGANNCNLKGSNGQNKKSEHFKLNFLETFFILKDQKNHNLKNNTDLKVFQAVESKEIQDYIFKNEALQEFLKDKTNRKKNYLLQKKYKAIMDINEQGPKTYEELHPIVSSLYSFQSMLTANELQSNTYIQEYRKKYLNDQQMTAEEVMKLPTVVNETQMLQKVQWSEVPLGNSNYFTTHRFIVMKGFNLNCFNNYTSNNFNNCLYDFVDVQKEMGEFIPHDVYAIISNQTQFDVQDWLCKKMFARPMNQFGQSKKKSNLSSQ